MSINQNTLHHKALIALEASPAGLKPEDWYNELGDAVDVKYPWFRDYTARHLEKAGFAYCEEHPVENGKDQEVYFITSKGVQALRSIANPKPQVAQIPRPPIVKANLVHTGGRRDDYYTPELGRTAHRPGAYDAYDKPSLINGKRYYRGEYANG